MRALNMLTQVLLIVGGLNWGLVGLANFDLVATLFGDMSPLSRIVTGWSGCRSLSDLAAGVGDAGVGEVDGQAVTAVNPVTSVSLRGRPSSSRLSLRANAPLMLGRSVERRPVLLHRQRSHDHHEQRQCAQARQRLGNSDALQHRPAHHAQHVGDGEERAEPLGPFRHSAEGEEEAAESRIEGRK